MKDFFNPNPVVLAHRGDSEFYPENTMVAFESAEKLGVDVIETDVHLTKDKKLIIWHDDHLKRITGVKDTVEEKTYDELMKLDVGKIFTKVEENGEKTYPFENKGIKFVLFEDLLTTLPNTKFNVDMKTDDLELPVLMAELLKRLDAFDRVCVTSFHSRVVLKFREIAPNATTSFTLKEVLKYSFTAKLGLSFIFKNKTLEAKAFEIPVKEKGIRILTKPFIKFCKKHDAKILVWTINDRKTMNKLLDLGVDGIFTDNPRLLQEVLKERAKN